MVSTLPLNLLLIKQSESLNLQLIKLANFITSPLYKNIFPKLLLFTCSYCIDLCHPYYYFVIHHNDKNATLFFSVIQNLSTESEICSGLH